MRLTSGFHLCPKQIQRTTLCSRTGTTIKVTRSRSSGRHALQNMTKAMLLRSLLIAVVLTFSGADAQQNTTALCAAQNKELANTQAVSNALNALSESNTEQVTQCIQNSQTTCTVTGGTGFQVLEPLCIGQDGIPKTTEATFNCQAADTGTTWVFSFPIAACFGQNCSESLIEATFTSLLDNQVISLADAGYGCEYTVGSQDEAASGAVSRFMLAAKSLAIVAFGIIVLV